MFMLITMAPMYQIFQSHARSFQWFLYIMGMWKILLMKPSENCWRQDSILDGQLDAGIVMQRPVENALVQIEREILIASILAQLQAFLPDATSHKEYSENLFATNNF